MSKIFYKIIAMLSFLIITSTSAMAEAPKPVEPPKVLSVKEVIALYAKQYDAEHSELIKVAMCESSLKPAIRGDGGSAFGIFQYHRPTFDRFAKLMGENLDYYSYNDQAKLTAWIWVNYPKYKSHWTCSKITGVL